jgi:hypothetical protein
MWKAVLLFISISFLFSQSKEIDLCEGCLVLGGLVENYVDSNYTIAEIRLTLQGICGLLPSGGEILVEIALFCIF